MHTSLSSAPDMERLGIYGCLAGTRAGAETEGGEVYGRAWTALATLAWRERSFPERYDVAV
jgi:hypothetical protein